MACLQEADVAAGWWQGEYLFSPGSWAPTSPIVGEFSGISSPEFAERFLLRTGEPAASNDATVYSMLSVLCDAIERAGTLDTHSVATALEETNLTEMLTDFRYDAKCVS